MIDFVYNGKNILALVRDLTDSGLAEVALRIAETHPEVFARAVLNDPVVAVTYIHPSSGLVLDVTKEMLNHIKETSDKIRAIKYLREQLNCGLREAKDLSEWLAANDYVNHKSWVPFNY